MAQRNYEMVSIYRLGEDVKEDLLANARECVFNWCTKDEWPMGVIMSCLCGNGGCGSRRAPIGTGSRQCVGTRRSPWY